MVKCLITKVQNKPGELHRIVMALGNENVNINGITAFTTGEQGTIALITDNVEKGQQALKNAKVEVHTQEYLSKRLPNKPGELARFTKQLADKGVNIRQVVGSVPKGATEAEIYFDVDDVNKAKPFFT